MALTASRVDELVEAPQTPRLPRGLALVGLGVVAAKVIHEIAGTVPMLVAAVVIGAAIGNSRLSSTQVEPGLSFASTTLLRAGIVLLGLRLSVGDVIDLGFATLGVVVLTVLVTFFSVQAIGRRLGLSPGLSLLVASGFSICGNSAIASVNGVAKAEDEEVAAAVGLVTVCGTLAIVAVPTLGSVFGLSTSELGVWTGASVQDTAQVIAVASTAGPAVLAVATAVKLTRVLFLAPIVAGVSLWTERSSTGGDAARPTLMPRFVLGFLVAMILRTVEVLPETVLDQARQVEAYALAAGMVGLGSGIRLANVRRLGLRPVLLGAIAWFIVGATSLAAVTALNL